MGSKKDKEEQEIELVEFLYKDMNYIDSFYSQIFQGNLQKISKNSASKDAVVNQLSGSVGFVSGEVNSNSENTEGIVEEILPHDSKVIKLFDELTINPCNTTKESKIKGLNRFHGVIEILDNEYTKEQFEILEQTGLLDAALKLNEVVNNDKNVATIVNQGLSLSSLVCAMVKMQTNGCDIILTLNNKEQILIPIDRKFLTMRVEDILRVYGNFMPGEWNVVGIYDNVRIHSSSNTIDSAIKEVQVQMDGAFGLQKPKSVLKPIAIYRKLK